MGRRPARAPSCFHSAVSPVTLRPHRPKWLRVQQSWKPRSDQMKMVRLVLALAALTAAFSGFEARAETASPVVARNVVLVHGAWADGSSWAGVIPYLQAAGLKVTAVQNPLTSLQDFGRRDAPRIGVAGRPDRAGRALLGRHRHQRDRDRPEGVGAGLRGRAGSRCRRGFCRAVREVSRRSGTRRRPGPRRFHPIVRGFLPQIFRQRRRAEDGGKCSTPCRSRRPRRCSAGGPPRRRGTPSRHGMRSPSSIRPSIPTSSDFWQNA